jgi:deoxycytidylate deaminase
MRNKLGWSYRIYNTFCINCAKVLVGAGIFLIKYHNNYNNGPLVNELLVEAGVAILKS